MRRDVYSGYVKLKGREHANTLLSANNYANCLLELRRFEEAKLLLRKTIPVARRVLGDDVENTLRLRWLYGMALCDDPGVTLDDLREAVTTLEDAARISRRVLGSTHPTTESLDDELRMARAALRARESS